MVRRLFTPSLAAGTSAVSRNGGCLTCRSPHREVPSRFERAPEAALVRHPCAPTLPSPASGGGIKGGGCCGGRPRSRSAVANHPIAFQAMPIARSVSVAHCETCASSGTQRKWAMRPRDVVQTWVDAFNRADVDALTALYRADATNHHVPESSVTGREAIRAMLAAGFDMAEM